MGNRLNVAVAGGKYTYIQREDYSSTALRYGEPWPAYDIAPPDNLHHALAAEVKQLRDGLRAIVDEWGPDSYAKEIARNLLAKHGGAE
jgi:hypothetical protein